MLPPEIAQLQTLLAQARFREPAFPTYRLSIPDLSAESYRVSTWTHKDGFQPGAVANPTCVIELRVAALSALLGGSATTDQLIETKELTLGGLFEDVLRFSSLFLPREARLRFDQFLQDASLSTARRQGLRDEAAQLLTQVSTSSEELRRIHTMLSMWVEHRVDRVVPNQVVTIGVPGMTSEAWLDPAELGIDSLFHDAFVGLRKEAEQLVNGTVVAAQYGSGDPEETRDHPIYPNPKGWRYGECVSRYRKIPEHISRFPVAEKVLDAVAERHPLMHAGYLILEPGVVLDTHVDGSLWSVSYHFCVMTPSEAYAEVNGERRPYRENQPLMFNDAFYHRVANPGASPRVTLSINCPSPTLSTVEQKAFQQLMMNGYTNIVSLWASRNERAQAQ